MKCDRPVFDSFAEAGDCFNAPLSFDKDAINSFSEFLERTSHTQGSCLENSLIKNYVERTLKLHCHIFPEGSLHFRDYCIRVEFADADEEYRHGEGIVARNGRTLMDRLSNGEQLMLIAYIEFLKRPEAIKVRLLSRVRLQTVDKLECISGHSLQPPLPLVEGFRSVANNEHRVPVIPVSARQSPSHIIEGTSEVVDAIADDESEVRLREVRLCRELYQVATGFSVVVEDGLIGIALKENINFRVKRFQMFFPALQLPPALE